jgi:hypothetical protein
MIDATIRELASSTVIIIRCPSCGGEFPSAASALFDANAPLPPAPQAKLKALHAVLGEQRAAHVAHVERVKRRTNVAARATNLGKVVERVAPALHGFPAIPAECRSLGEPIDLVWLPGLLRGRVESVVLVDIKSGAARLSRRQRQIRDAVDTGNVTVSIVVPPDGDERHP